MYDARVAPARDPTRRRLGGSESLAAEMHLTWDMRFLCAGLVLAVAVGACGGSDAEQGRVARHAAAVLGIPASALRITARSDLASDRHAFYLVTPPTGASLVVVVPHDGALFDSRTPDAFTRVARAEQAVTRLSHLGAERVAAWFGALGGGACAPPPVDQAHFATVTRPDGGGAELSYHVQNLTCTINLDADGALVTARQVTTSAPNASTTRSWKSDSRN
jgi:hypothetical protein